ncbi:unnamed protein product [Phytomonas sp. Hart1]|nr:unnamed protein product [Phytomonas sp. Hart1]|eukprot:CCW69819.1 unnamed protein product [Phytomonas sp. isolate Hart1]
MRIVHESHKLTETGLGQGGTPEDTNLAPEMEVTSEGSWLADLGGDTWATEGIDPQLLTSAAGIFAQCVAPEDNEEGFGLDNCSLIILERRA